MSRAAELKAVNPPGWAVWTDERSDMLRQLWDQGHTCSVIAEMMGDGVTRNAVIGRARRMSLPSRGKNPGKAKSRGWSQAAKERQMRARLLRKLFGERPNIPTAEVPINANAWDALPGSTPVPLSEVTGCRWPIGQDAPYLFCGKAHAPGRSYCREHQQISSPKPTGKRGLTLGKDSVKADSASSSDGRFVLANKPAAAIEAQEPWRVPATVNTSVRSAA